MTDEQVDVTSENSQSAKTKILNLLPKIAPIIALCGAALALIFTFVIGVNTVGGDAYFYRYFGGSEWAALDALEGSAESAVRTTLVLGLLVGIFGLIAVMAFALLCALTAVFKYVLKRDVVYEKFAFGAYFSYIAFASLNFALSNIVSDGVSVSYNAATIAGIVLTTVTMSAYVGIRIFLNASYFKDKYRLSDFIYTAVRFVVLILIAGLITAPVLSIKLGEDGQMKTNFVQLIYQSLFTRQGNRLDSVASSAAGGFVSVAAVLILSLALGAFNLFSLFKTRKNDKVFYIIYAIVSFVHLFFATIAASFFTDIYEGATFGIAVPIAITILSVLLCAAVIVYPIVIDKIKREEDKKKTAGQSDAFLEVKNLSEYFVVGRDFFGRPTKYLKAVDNVSFKLQKGKTLGIVGESGCGKTTMGRTILRLYNVTGGEVWFKGQKISDLSNRDFDKLRHNMQMIFQDPYASLSPRLTVGEIIGEAVKQHKLVSKSEYHDYVLNVMKMCGLQPHYFERYPHEFSGGQRQRICIARALALKPELVICDEPVSALDVSIQAQIINMLIELRKSLGLTYIFISHDLSVVKHISDMVGVMYLGSMVEYGSRDSIFENTLHPYTKALFSAVPVPDPHVKMNRIILKGDIPSPVNPPSGCKFHTRCESCMEICGRITPKFKEVEEGHFCACHLYNTPEEVEALEAEYAEQQRLEELEREDKKKGVWETLKGMLPSFGKKNTVSGEEDNVEKEG